MSSFNIHEILEQLYAAKSLTSEQSQAFFERVVQGQVDPIILSSVLTALKIKGETAQEITGAANALLAQATPFPRPDYDFTDIVGTGGDGLGTINISTASAFVAAACGLKVCKHGSRSVSSKSGSSDLLAAFGLNLDMSAQQARQCLDDLNICFLFAPQYHAGMRFAAPVRAALKTRSIFNVLGPLINPARPQFELMGVYAPELLKPIAEVHKELGMKRVMVVYGSGLDEIALHGETQVAELIDGKIIEYTLTPEDFGVQHYPVEAIIGGDPSENKIIIEQILQGKGSDAQQAAVAVNVSALLVLNGKADNFKEGTKQALAMMLTGKPLQLLKTLAERSQC
ncbi:anthranilate phosphoribosyltransferase [Psychromonas ingrahamii 37]|uniref:Anthranilate phosphoribosyltransferase n=1 Tax=Psychromonas ingrahamii (strain DSM 17664 / CCUG 51855 / 37) TaxID=357804 RepID=TRPD_PSYIN|nr:anthranilate phosphoribosyltransferase [Psychromonas ingrahamii]A1STT2.1 RecName: Full=Anthranilate phosphoribosyltransferase [Psychromonas ingrahamii 37]ABM02897.1 anthranilate phosphoribosyltransferase [Psychromonas ingrahamii 37]